MVTLPVLPRPEAGGRSSAQPQSGGTLWQLGIESQELTRQISALAELLASEDEEIQQQAISRLEVLLSAEADNREALAAKADATCWVIEHLRAQGQYRQEQSRRLLELGRADAARAERLESSLLTVLTTLQPGATRFSLPHHELISRRSERVAIEAPELVAAEWLTVKTTSQPDKTAIKAALKAGQLIDGAQLVEHRSWQIR